MNPKQTKLFNSLNRRQKKIFNDIMDWFPVTNFYYAYDAAIQNGVRFNFIFS